jgi:hypothetical protein
MPYQGSHVPSLHAQVGRNRPPGWSGGLVLLATGYRDRTAGHAKGPHRLTRGGVPEERVA